jgi:hypothetical protein
VRHVELEVQRAGVAPALAVADSSTPFDSAVRCAGTVTTTSLVAFSCGASKHGNQ